MKEVLLNSSIYLLLHFEHNMLHQQRPSLFIDDNKPILNGSISGPNDRLRMGVVPSPSEIFSPESAGSTKMSRVMDDSSTQGMSRFRA